MFIIREVDLPDLSCLYELSQLANFLNLPRNKDLLLKKINKSKKSFSNLTTFNPENSFLFVIEDTKKKKIVGCSNLHAKHGTPHKPHYYLKVSEENKFSPTQELNFTHQTLKLQFEENGYSEIGGLVIHPDYRGHQQKLGKQISYSRFLFIAKYPHLFTEYIHSELMPPFEEDGNSPLWTGLGEKFFKMDYLKADIISTQDKKFILNLFPKETIYTQLLSEPARNAIGKVGKKTKPVQKMLESIGFTYQNEVDPFDGGPHYRCKKGEISLIKYSLDIKISIKDNIDSSDKSYLLSPLDSDKFIAVKVNGYLKGKDLHLSSSYLDGYVDKSLVIEKYNKYKMIKL